MANIRKVAERAGVSAATVSHVFNGTRHVSDEVRQRVVAVATELDYFPNYFARGLSTNRSGTIGMVILDITNPFFAEVVRACESVLRPFNYNLIVCNTDGRAETEEEYLRLLMSRRVDGIIAAVTSQRWVALQRAQARGFPLVFVDHLAEGMEGHLVCVDNERGTAACISHLVADGHRRIGMVVGPSIIGSMRERLVSYRRAVREHGLADEELLVRQSEMTIDCAAMQTTALLSHTPRPTAIFLANSVLALGALQALEQLGLSCPEDVALASFDDTPWMAISDPHMTAVRQPTDELGALAGQLLMQAIRGEDVPESAIRLEPKLIVRASCRADGHHTAQAQDMRAADEPGAVHA